MPWRTLVAATQCVGYNVSSLENRQGFVFQCIRYWFKTAGICNGASRTSQKAFFVNYSMRLVQVVFFWYHFSMDNGWCPEYFLQRASDRRATPQSGSIHMESYGALADVIFSDSSVSLNDRLKTNLVDLLQVCVAKNVTCHKNMPAHGLCMLTLVLTGCFRGGYRFCTSGTQRSGSPL